MGMGSIGSGLLATALAALAAALQPAGPPQSSTPAAMPTAKPAAPAGWRFVDVVAESGIDFRHSFGDDQFSKILEDTGSGVALIDQDGDGLLDVFLSSGHWVEGLSDPAFKERTAGARSRLYRNLGGMKFKDVTDEVGITDRGFGMGAVVGDVDADGDEDLYVLNWGPNVLYRNDVDASGARRFTDVTAAAGIAGPEKLNGQRKWSVNGLFFDYDRDGDLDLYVANYLAFDAGFRDPDLPKEYPYEGPESYRGQQSLLYRNDGQEEVVRFTDVTKEANLLLPDGKSMGAVACDFDGDGDLDLFEAMDSTPNVFWRNEAGRLFLPFGGEIGTAFDSSGSPMASMHGSVGDVDGDGAFDLFVPDLASGCLYHNEMGAAAATPELEIGPAGKATNVWFEEDGAKRGIAQLLKGSGAWGSTFQDFDLDGDVDLLVVLGGAFDLKAGEHDRLFLNDGAGKFTDVSEQLGPSFQKKLVSRGAAFGDLDNDGDLDYVVNVKDVGAPPRIMRNDLPHAPAASGGAAGEPPATSKPAANAPHWLVLKLVGAGRDLDAIGARVELTAGGRTQVRQVNRADSYLSQCDSRVFFGLGAATTVESLTIVWPTGPRQQVQVDGVNRMLVVREKSSP
jgi:hypothetical protein